MEKVKLKKFSKKELRRDFYPMFLDLIEKGFKIESLLLMLATWNFANFRYAIKGFNLYKFKKTIEDLTPLFNKFQKEDFKTIDFGKYSKDIKKIYKKLSNLKGVQKTGASKIMHLLAPKVFVMWDSYIRNHYDFKKGDANEYLKFLELMRKKFSCVKNSEGRTIPKLIDEHNYKTITEPALLKNKLKRKS